VLVEELLDEHEEIVEVDGPGDAEVVLVAAVAGGGERPVLRGIGRDRLDGAVRTDRGALPTADTVDEISGTFNSLSTFRAVASCSPRSMIANRAG
jgi:hypothetical protein